MAHTLHYLYDIHKINALGKWLLDGIASKWESESEIKAGPRFLLSFMVTAPIDKWLGLRIQSQGLKPAAI